MNLFPADADGYGAEALQRDFPLSASALMRIHNVLAELDIWRKKFNLIGPIEHKQLWRRHVLDSVQLLNFAPAKLLWVDIGSGAGFPGLILACILADTPDAKVILVESQKKKAGFLRYVAHSMKLPVEVKSDRFESLAPESVDVITARAVAELSKLLGIIAPWAKLGAELLFLKGQDIQSELTKASTCWKLDYALMPSLSRSDGSVLHIKEMQLVKSRATHTGSRKSKRRGR